MVSKSFPGEWERQIGVYNWQLTIDNWQLRNPFGIKHNHYGQKTGQYFQKCLSAWLSKSVNWCLKAWGTEQIPSPGGKGDREAVDEERRQVQEHMRINWTNRVPIWCFFTHCTGNWKISPFLISHQNRFRSADFGDSFPPGEAKGAPAPVRQTPICRTAELTR